MNFKTHFFICLFLSIIAFPDLAISQEFPDMDAVTPRSERHPGLSPNNQNVVFSTGLDFDKDLAILDLSSGEITQLTSNNHEDSHPRWSPDGNWIVFQREDTMGNRDLYTIRRDGSQERNITNTPKYREQHPTFSTDGTLIIFDSNRDEKDLDSDTHNYEIYSMDVSTGKTRRLTKWNSWDMYPAFSPDNSHIVWRRSIKAKDSEKQNFEIFVKNLETDKEWNISNDKAYDSNPHWSPNNNLISFASSRDRASNIYLVKPDGTGLKKITQAKGKSIGFSKPTISFDGKRIVANRHTKGVVDMILIDISNY